MTKTAKEWKEWWNDEDSKIDDDNIYQYFSCIVKDINELNGQLKTANKNIKELKEKLKEKTK